VVLRCGRRGGGEEEARRTRERKRKPLADYCTALHYKLDLHVELEVELELGLGLKVKRQLQLQLQLQLDSFFLRACFPSCLRAATRQGRARQDSAAAAHRDDVRMSLVGPLQLPQTTSSPLPLVLTFRGRWCWCCCSCCCRYCTSYCWCSALANHVWIYFRKSAAHPPPTTAARWASTALPFWQKRGLSTRRWAALRSQHLVSGRAHNWRLIGW
jgi:hypothetical protein